MNPTLRLLDAIKENEFVHILLIICGVPVNVVLCFVVSLGAICLFFELCKEFFVTIRWCL